MDYSFLLTDFPNGWLSFEWEAIQKDYFLDFICVRKFKSIVGLWDYLRNSKTFSCVVYSLKQFIPVNVLKYLWNNDKIWLCLKIEEENRKQSDKDFSKNRHDDYEFCIFCRRLE